MQFVQLTLSAVLLASVAGICESRIVGGCPVKIQEVPFMVEVVTTVTKDNATQRALCGGTLVSEKHVLTAGHCVLDDSSARTVTGRAVRVGGQVVRVLAFRRHPEYCRVSGRRGTTAAFDVAVLRLKDAVWTSSLVAVIDIVQPSLEPAAGSSIAVAGWEAYKTPETASDKLRYGVFRVRSREECLQEFGKLFTRQEFCIESSLEHAFCWGDSGGPAFAGPVQYGVVSWGSCGNLGNGSGVLTNLADPEINSFVRKQIATL